MMLGFCVLVKRALGASFFLLGHHMRTDLVTAEGAGRIYTGCCTTRPVLLNFGELGSFDISASAPRVKTIDADYPAVGASGTRDGAKARRCADPASRTRPLGGGAHRLGSASGPKGDALADTSG